MTLYRKFKRFPNGSGPVTPIDELVGGERKFLRQRHFHSFGDLARPFSVQRLGHRFNVVPDSKKYGPTFLATGTARGANFKRQPG
jgi:hypothetical protein